MQAKLKSTGEKVFLLNWGGKSETDKPWSNKHHRVMIPKENLKNGKRAVIQIVKKDNLKFENS